MRQFAARTAVAASALVLAFGMTACGGSKDSAKDTSAKASNAASSAASQASKSFTSAAGGATSAAKTSAGAKSCPAGAVTAKIGGETKCIAKGQMCSKSNAKDYEKYGFKCDANGHLVTK